LPNIDELRSLVRGCADTETGGACGVTDGCLDYTSCWSNSCADCSGGGPGSGGFYWPAELSGNDNSPYYWSSSAVTNSLGEDWAWSIYFNAGSVDNASVTFSYSVRCVRD
jgi:hypothetical protein